MSRKRKPKEVDPTIAVAYLRVSTEDQHLGPDAQRNSIEEWGTREKISLVSWHLDHGVSGAAELVKRKALLEALEALRSTSAGFLVVANRSRLARKMMIAALIEQLVEREGARTISADGAGNEEGPEGELMRGLMDLFAQYERAVIQARTTAALAVKQRRGERTGSIPYGFELQDDGIHLIQNEVEQAGILEISRLRSTGLPLRKIAAQLTNIGIPCRGKRWHSTTIVRILATLEKGGRFLTPEKSSEHT